MDIEKVKQLKEGDRIYWLNGKVHYSGTFIKFTGNVTDMLLMAVKDDNGEEDEILNVFLIDEDTYNKKTSSAVKKVNSSVATIAPPIVKVSKVMPTVSVQGSLEKSDEVNDEVVIDEDDLSSAIDDYLEENVRETTKPKKLALPSPSFVPTVINKATLSKVSGHRDYAGGATPNLKTLQGLLKDDGIHIERDKMKWVRYHLILSDGTHETIDFSGKVFELYNIYLDSGINGILALKK